MRPTLIAVVSDIHAGSMLGLCPESVRLDDGGNYVPSKAQRWLWDCWIDFWDQVRVKQEVDNAILYVVLNGDAVEGDHHRTTQILSGNPEAQSYVLHRAVEIPQALSPDRWFVVRGTEAHVGPSGASEEALGRHLKAEQDPDTHTWSWWHLRMEVQGIRFDFQHHGKMGRTPWTRAGQVGNLGFQVWAEHMMAGFAPPDIAIRSHFHQYYDSGDSPPTRLIQTAAWQLKTAHGHKVAADSIADVGGLMLYVDKGKVEVQKVLYKPELPRVWKPM